MTYGKQALGKVFVSHSSVDKRTVRRIDKRLREEGYETWLDERELEVGDALAAKISEGVRDAKVVLVVVSKASLASNWLRYELDIATQRMIDGHCRVMPVLIDDVAVPPEVEGRLYADMRPRRRGGFKAILRTLESEADKYPPPAEPPTMTAANSWVRGRAYRAHLGDLSDGFFNASMDVSATRSVDLEGISLNERDVVVSFVSRYGRETALTVHDFEDWKHFVEEEINEGCGLLVSEQPPDTALAEQLCFEERIGSEVTKGLFKPSGLLVVADISGELADAEKADVLTRAVDKVRAAIETSEPPALDLEAIRAAARAD